MKPGLVRVLDLARRQGIVRTRDITVQRLPRVLLTRLVRQGALERVGRGLYAIPGRPVSQHMSLAAVAKKCPKAVVCLLSALRFHDLTTQSPGEVWLAIPNKARAPQLDYPPLRILRFSNCALADGVERHKVEGIPVRITGIARTVVDCFKFRNKVGLDVALEALREARRTKRASVDQLWSFATRFRMANVMRPYLETIA